MADGGSRGSWSWRFAVATVVVGVLAGAAGTGLALLLHAVQHLAYGYTEGSFLSGVEAAAPARRVVAMAVGGIVAGTGWWALYRFGQPLVGVEEAVAARRPHMPALSTTWHALLQIVTVGLGSPLGRETAPRQLAALFATAVCRHPGLTVGQRRVLVASAAGGGLAAVYDVPLGGTVFTLEVLLGTWAVGALVPAAAVAALATVISWAALPDEPAFHLTRLTVGASLVVWSAVAGPLIGLCAHLFSRACARAGRSAPRGRMLLLTAPAAFVLIGLLAIPYPQLLGNGKGPAEVAFTTQPALGLTAVLLALRTLVVLLTLRAGARGGLLTPSVANGALLGVLAGGVWALVWPGTTLAAHAVVGGAAFLAAAQRIPLTAVVLMLEFTDAPRALVVPVLFATVGAMAVQRLCAARPARAHRRDRPPPGGAAPQPRPPAR
ncbi:chloride channel protein [Streptomyces sp. NPDC093225]|uniref:chloride channel protein n=1 Tax=Streptomyces sp. NPDC093225 TaxID=3366034 RepID=UPI00380A4004